MAAPQVENGYLKLTNETVEHFCRYRISGEEWMMLMVIFRKTYGWNKKEDEISLSQFARLTGLRKQSCFRAIKKLHQKGVIKKGCGKVVKYSFEKDYGKWKSYPKKGTSRQKRVQVVPNIVYASYPILSNTKDTTTKDTIQKTKEQQEPAAEFSTGFQHKAKIAKAHGFNIYALMNRFYKQSKLNRRLPEEVLLGILNSYWQNKDRVKDPWPYFITTLKERSAQHFAKENEREHKKIKDEKKTPSRLKITIG